MTGPVKGRVHCLRSQSHSIMFSIVTLFILKPASVALAAKRSTAVAGSSFAGTVRLPTPWTSSTREPAPLLLCALPMGTLLIVIWAHAVVRRRSFSIIAGLPRTRFGARLGIFGVFVFAAQSRCLRARLGLPL